VLGHEALRQPVIKEEIARRWGREVFDAAGEVDRRRLGHIVFADQAELKALEALTFPWIERRIAEEIALARQGPAVRLIVLDAAIMLEAGWNRCCDRVVYVHAPRDVRHRRVAEQRGWSAKEVETRAGAQMSLTDKVSRADDVVDNSRSAEETARRVDELLRQWGVEPPPTPLEDLQTFPGP